MMNKKKTNVHVFVDRKQLISSNNISEFLSNKIAEELNNVSLENIASFLSTTGRHIVIKLMPDYKKKKVKGIKK